MLHRESYSTPQPHVAANGPLLVTRDPSGAMSLRALSLIADQTRRRSDQARMVRTGHGAAPTTLYVSPSARCAAAAPAAAIPKTIKSASFSTATRSIGKSKSRVWVEEALARRRCRLLEDSILVDPYGPEFCVFRAKRGQHAEVWHLLSPGLPYR